MIITRRRIHYEKHFVLAKNEVPDTYLLLEQEAYVIRSCLCTGLTDIRNANLNDKGRYYTAFFHLAIGIERMSKLALILDHMAQNNLQPPGESLMINYGHDLEGLFVHVRKASQMRGHTFTAKFDLSPLATRILRFLTQFAKSTRYANLSALASGHTRIKPLHEWNRILQDIINTKINNKTKQQLSEKVSQATDAIQNISFVTINDLSGDPMTLASAYYKPALIDIASKDVVWEILTILDPLRKFLDEVGCAAGQTTAARSQIQASIPAMREFFDFMWLNRSYVRRKKRWP